MKKLNTYIKAFPKQLVILLSLWTFPVVCAAEISIIVHPKNPMASMTIKEVTRIYLGKQKTFSNGERVVPLDVDRELQLHKNFYHRVVKKSDAQLKSYWSRLVFTGKAQPPKAVLDSVEVMTLVAADPNMIGYIETDQVDDSVKVVLTIP